MLHFGQMFHKVKSVALLDGGDVCQVLWEDDHVSKFHAMWLKFNCNCRKCLVPGYALNKVVDLSSIPENIFIDKVMTTDQEISLEFGNETIPNHTTFHNLVSLRELCYCDDCLLMKLNDCDVISQSIDVIKNKGTRCVPTINYDKILTNPDQGVFEWVKRVIESGFCVLENVPTKPNAVLEAAKKICYIDETNYGRIFNVVADNALNFSNTGKPLALHQDLVQYENAVGVQMLHALKFDSCVVGGYSTFVDAFEAAEILRRESPEDFQSLVEIPVIFSTIDYERKDPFYPIYLRHQRPHIALDYFGKIVGVNWSPATTSPLQAREKDINRYFKANRKFTEIIERKDIQFRFKLKAGDLVCFNNRRMLHGREGFDLNGGQRHLQGTYVKLDELKSKFVTLAKKLNVPIVPPKVGNNSSI